MHFNHTIFRYKRYIKIPYCRVFPRLFTYRGDLSPHMGGTSAGQQSVNGGETHEGGHRPYGGPNFDRLYHKLKVLLLLSCNYMMQFISYDSIKTR